MIPIHRMGIILIILLLILLAGFLALVAVSCGSSPLAPAARIMLALTCGAMALFCVYGFLASFEPSANANWFKFGYGFGFLVLITLAGWAIFPRSASGDD